MIAFMHVLLIYYYLVVEGYIQTVPHSPNIRSFMNLEPFTLWMKERSNKVLPSLTIIHVAGSFFCYECSRVIVRFCSPGGV